MLHLTRRYRFSASHRLHLAFLSEAENQALYGKCNNPYGHGHNYVLEVSVAGRLDKKTGQVARVDILDALVKSNIVETLDHRNLNRDLPTFTKTVPTTENIALEIRNVLEKRWASAFPSGQPVLAGIRLLETKRNSVELKS